MRPLWLLAALPLFAAPGAVENARYRIRVAGVNVEVAAGKAVRTFAPRFLVLRSEKDPQIALRWATFTGRQVQYNVSTWATATARAQSAGATGHVADGFNPAFDQAAGAGRTANAFRAAPFTTVLAERAVLDGRTVRWTFGGHPGFVVAASLELPQGDAEPVLWFEFTPKRDGWYSVAYTGAPETSPQAIDEMWQPLVWQEGRFPQEPFLTEAYRCPVPGTLVTESGVTTSVVADPVELPFQPLPTFANSRFGVAVRNGDGRAQSVVFAPMLGGAGSMMTAGQPFAFRIRLVVNAAPAFETYRHVAEKIYGFHDYRRNDSISLNRTFENMAEFAMSQWARFDEELRGSAYDTDVPGSVKNISALHPLGIALVTDNEEFWTRRARPMIEYGISRERFLFSTDPNVKGQGASSKLTGPGVPISEVAALYSMTGGRMPFLLQSAKDLLTRKRVLNLDADVDGSWWGNHLALYRASGDRQWLEKAKAGADAYIAKRVNRKQTDFEDPDSRGMFFWTSFAPQWMDLYEIWQTTGERHYLDAALRGAREFTEFVWMCPVIPQGDVLVNEGGVAPAYRTGKNLQRIEIAEERAPAWRLSEIGLTPESSGTSKGHRGIFLTNFAPYLLRLGAEGKDDFLSAVGRSAVVGRYTGFPGYHINTARTTVYEKPSFAMRPMAQLNSTTSIHYNHILAQTAMVLDYLVSDAVARSGGRIDFPSQYAEGYGYVTSKVYGDRAGTFYGDRDVRLWMPKGLVSVDTPQLNYVSARGHGKVYVAFTNQSAETVRATVRLNPSLAPAAGTRAVRVWRQNAAAARTTMRDGAMPVEVAPRGITAIAVEDMDAAAPFQKKVAAAGGAWRKDEADVALAKGHARLINMGPALRSVYFYVQETSNELNSVTLHYSTGGAWREVKDTSYPYEFTIPLAEPDRQFRFRYEVARKDGSTARSDEAVLERRALP
jgi:hypothetical protein